MRLRRLLFLEDKGVAEEFGLTLEGLAGAAGIAHEGDLLANEAGDIDDVALAVCGFALIERMVAVDVNDVSLGEGFRGFFAEAVNEKSQTHLADLELLDESAGR